jgi:peroxiredoxin
MNLLSPLTTHIGKRLNSYEIIFYRPLPFGILMDVMARIAAAIIFVLLTGPIEAKAQETVEQILDQTEEVYKNLQAYHFRGFVSYEWVEEDKSTQTFHNSFQSFRGKGGKFRHQSGIGMSKVLAATDGTRSLLFLADKGQYQYSDLTDLEEFIKKGLKLENAAWIFPVISLLDKYSDLKARFHNPRLMPPQILKMNGEPVNCYVLKGIMESADIDAVRGNPETELWIHKGLHVVLREIHTGTSSGHSVMGENLIETIAFNIAEPNPDPPDEVFEFKPPQGTEEVKEFFISRNTSGDEAVLAFDNRAHSFYYELPFLKIKHFRLPTVDGEELAFSGFRGKYVLLDFWATWCVPCHKQMKDLEKVLRRYEGKDLVVLGLNNEELDVTRAFLEKRDPDYPMLVDVGGELASLYGVKNLPALILLDRSGNILSKKSERQTYKQIDKLLIEAGL